MAPILRSDQPPFAPNRVAALFARSMMPPDTYVRGLNKKDVSKIGYRSINSDLQNLTRSHEGSVVRRQFDRIGLLTGIELHDLARHARQQRRDRVDAQDRRA